MLLVGWGINWDVNGYLIKYLKCTYSELLRSKMTIAMEFTITNTLLCNTRKTVKMMLFGNLLRITPRLWFGIIRFLICAISHFGLNQSDLHELIGSYGSPWIPWKSWESRKALRSFHVVRELFVVVLQWFIATRRIAGNIPHRCGYRPHPLTSTNTLKHSNSCFSGIFKCCNGVSKPSFFASISINSFLLLSSWQTKFNNISKRHWRNIENFEQSQNKYVLQQEDLWILSIFIQVIDLLQPDD